MKTSVFIFSTVQRRLAAVFIVLGVASGGAADLKREQASQATKSSDEPQREVETPAQSEVNERTQRERSEQREAELRRRLHEASMGDYAHAVQRIDKDGKWHEGIACLVRALKWDPANPLPAIRLYSTLSLYAAENQNWPRLTLRHPGWGVSAHFSPDGTRILTVSEDGNTQVWDAATGRAIGEPRRYGGPDEQMLHAHFGPEGSRIATVTQDGTVRVWDMATGRAIGEPLRHRESKGQVKAKISPDGARIATMAGTIARVWDAATGLAISEPLILRGLVGSLQFSPDGTRIVFVYSLGRFVGGSATRLWDGKTLSEPLMLEGKDYDGARSAHFSPDGTTIVTLGDRVLLWDAATGKPSGSLLKDLGAVSHGKFSPDGTRILAGGYGLSAATMWVRDAATGKALGGPLPGYFDAHFSPDGTRIITTGFENNVHVWDAPTGKVSGLACRLAGAGIFPEVSRNGTHILAGGRDPLGTGVEVRTFDIASGKAIGTPMRHPSGVYIAKFSPDDSLILTVHAGGVAQLWEAVTGKAHGAPIKHKDRVKSAEFSPDGTRILTASENMAQLWDSATGQAHGEPLRQEGVVRSAHFSQDGSRIVTTSSDGTALVWDAVTRRALGVPFRYRAPGQDFEDELPGSIGASSHFSPDGSRIVTRSAHMVHLWDAATGRELGQPMCDTQVKRTVHFSPDGSRILTAGVRARLWDTTTGIQSWLLEEGTSACFSPDGTHIVTTSTGYEHAQTARIRDFATGQALGEPLRHDYPVFDPQFTLDGSRILTITGDGAARLWDVGTQRHLPSPVPEWLRERASAIAGLKFSPDGELLALSSSERLATLTQPVPGDDAWAALARWLVLPAAERPLTPESRFTCRQIAERERDTLVPAGLESAIRYDPTVPLARLLLAAHEPAPERARFLRVYELKHLPDDAALWARASAILLAQKQAETALTAARKAVALDPKLPAAQSALTEATASAEQSPTRKDTELKRSAE